MPDLIATDATYIPYYFFCLAVTLLCLYLLWRIVHSPFGLMLASLRENSRRKSLTVLFTEHKMDMVFSIASHIADMNFGQVIAAGEPEIIRRDERVQQVYFGGDTC
ncbi:MAG: hypothetical protein AB1512_09240 [Thermodesulfobacteriota bacterium]